MASSFADQLAASVTDCGRATTLLDCLCTTSKPALYSPDSTRPALTHDALHAFITAFRLPASVPARRLGPNHRVMVALPTGCENAVAVLALAAYHTVCPVNASCTAAELREDIERLGARAVVTTRDTADRLELHSLDCDVVFIDSRQAGPAGLFDMALMEDPEYVNVSLGAAESSADVPSRPHGLYDQSLVLKTSGTSGKSKVVPYTLRSLIIGTLAVVKSWDLRDTDVNLNMMPLFHVGGIVRNLFAPIMSGGCAIVATGFDATAFWSLATEFGATWYYAAPTMHHAILSARPEGIVPSKDTRIRMICNAAGGLLPTLALELKETFGGAAVLPSYGMTECMPIASPPTSYQLDRPGCSGIACGPYLSIRDPSNIERELPAGSYGNVCVRGLPTFEGYEVALGAPLDTSVFSSEGWFDSGDCGYLDSDGYLYITGRSKEIINKGGEVVSPFEVEEAVLTVAKDRVKNTLAFSIEHDVLQETIGIVVVPAPGKPRISLADLLDLLRDRLHPSKWPFAIVYMEDLPKNAAGKPLRIKLAQRMGLGCLSDDVPAVRRHFTAAVPDKLAALSEPIECARVSVDADTVRAALTNVLGVADVAVRMREDDSVEAFVEVDASSSVDALQIRASLATTLHGYLIPDPLYVFDHELPRTDGDIDWASLEDEVKTRSASGMSAMALTVRNIVANVLSKDAATISGDSDFFLLGGNSLLLGRLGYFIRKETGTNIKVSDLFTNSTINGITSLIAAQQAATISRSTLAGDKEKYADSMLSYYPPSLSYGEGVSPRGRGQTHPVSLFIQILPLLFFYPLKAAWTWTMILWVLGHLIPFLGLESFWSRIGSLLLAILCARLSSRILAPVASIAFKWIVIGKYQPGRYRMWSTYHLRWWIVQQSLRAAGRGVFSMHPALEKAYYRLLGAKIGKNVTLEKSTRLAEVDLIEIGDGVRIDKALVRGFCVERGGYFRLDRIVIGRGAIVNSYTQIAPGAVIPESTVYGPHSSSHEAPSPQSHATSNRAIRKPHFLLQLFVATPIIIVIKVAAYVPWFYVLYLMIADTNLKVEGLSPMESVIEWFASPQRIIWHTVARIIRAVFTPLLQLALGIAVKRIMGLNRAGPMAEASQWSLLRRHINFSLLAQPALKRAFDILGTHYEMTSIVFRAMGAKIGRRVYWPGSGIYCPDPELLEIGDDVVFGSRSEIFTTDAQGSGKITIGAGAMIADRVVLLPDSTVGRKTVMGSGALGTRGGVYPAGTTWMGSENGEAVCFSKSGAGEVPDDEDTITPFGRAFYKREASFFVIPYVILVLINIFVATISAAFWSCSAVAAAQMLRQLRIHLDYLNLFADNWYHLAILYGLVAASFCIVLPLQAVLAMLWTIGAKWLVIGQRKAGPCEWDKSSYCQRWQLHLTLMRPLRGCGNGGVLAAITGSAYIVWYFRALGAKIGKECSIWAGGRPALMTEPDLVQLGDRVALDDCSVVAHINSRGKFALNNLHIGHGCAMRSGSRLLSGASMEDNSMLLEHTLLPSGETADENTVYVGWPARPLTHGKFSSGQSTPVGVKAKRV